MSSACSERSSLHAVVFDSPRSTSTHQYTRLIAEWNHELLAQIRRCGRKAGKRLGYEVRTLTSDPQPRDDRRVTVWAVVTSANPDDEDRIRQRCELLISQTLNQLARDTPLPEYLQVRGNTVHLAVKDVGGGRPGGLWPARVAGAFDVPLGHLAFDDPGIGSVSPFRVESGQQQAYGLAPQ